MIYIILFILLIVGIITDKDTSHDFDLTDIYKLIDTIHTHKIIL